MAGLPGYRGLAWVGDDVFCLSFTVRSRSPDQGWEGVSGLTPACVVAHRIGLV